MEPTSPPVFETHTYIQQTHLSRKPRTENTIVGFIAVGVLLLVSMINWSGLFGLAPLLHSSGQQVFAAGEYWRLFTALGVHGDIGHLLSNALGFGLFAYLLYDYFGFWVFPGAMVVLGAAVNALALMTYKPEIRLIGASGMVYLMVGFWLVQYAFIERRLKVSSRFMRCMGFALAALMPSTFEQTVSYRTHGIGFAVGAAFGLLYFAVNCRRFRAAEVTATELVEMDASEPPRTSVDPDLDPLLDDDLETEEPHRGEGRVRRAPRRPRGDGSGTV